MCKLHLACVIDDDSIIRSVFEKLISTYKIADKTLCFENGQPALNYLNKYKDDPDHLPEFILLDIRMPVVDGWDFMQAFAVLAPKLSKPVAVYIVSSSLDNKDRQKARSSKLISGFVNKPITLNALNDIKYRLKLNIS